MEVIGNVQKEKREKSKAEDIIEGISISIVFIVIGIALFFLPTFFKNEIFTTIVGVISLVIGIIGLSLELSKMSEKSIGLDDFGVGLGMLIVWAAIYFYVPFKWMNFISIFILFFGLYGFISGIVKMVYGFFQANDSKSEIFIKVILIIIQLIGFISAVVTIVSALSE